MDINQSTESYDYFHDRAYSAEELGILLRLWNGFGSHFEENEDHQSSGFSWAEVNDLVNLLIKIDGTSASETALRFILTPETENKTQEWKNRYLRGTGLTLLKEGTIISKICSMFHSTTREAMRLSYQLAAFLSEFMANPDILRMTKQEAFSTPEFYSFIVSLLIVKKMNEYVEGEYTHHVSALMAIADNSLSNPLVIEKISWYLEIEDTKDLAEELLSYL